MEKGRVYRQYKLCWFGKSIHSVKPRRIHNVNVYKLGTVSAKAPGYSWLFLRSLDPASLNLIGSESSTNGLTYVVELILTQKAHGKDI